MKGKSRPAVDARNRSDHATNVTKADGNAIAVSDIVERLRKATPYGLDDPRVLAEAADEIERLRRELVSVSANKDTTRMPIVIRGSDGVEYRLQRD